MAAADAVKTEGGESGPIFSRPRGGFAIKEMNGEGVSYLAARSCQWTSPSASRPAKSKP